MNSEKQGSLFSFLKWISLPFALVYGLVTLVRNWWFDIQWSRGVGKVQVKTIVVGNLSAGGTGKSPFVKFLWENDARIKVLKPDRVAMLSRGYGRKTKGFKLVGLNDSALDVGDEPLMLKYALPKSIIAVCENRVQGINTLYKLYPQLELIVLDDAFQHRRLLADEYVLLTTYENLFTRDFLLPVGNLREWRTGAKRASRVVVTKSPQSLSIVERKKIINEIAIYTKAPVAFASLVYDEFIRVQGMGDVGKHPLLVSGIANPRPLVEYLSQKGMVNKHLEYNDHHSFSISDIKAIVETMKNHTSLITTEKDWVRLKSLLPEEMPVFIQRVEHKILR